MTHRDGTADLESIANNLIEIGVSFVAISNQPLEDGYLHLVTFAPGNSKIDGYARELKTEPVTVDGEEFEFHGISNALHSEVHLQNRVPLYAEKNPYLGLPDVSLKEGFTNLREYLAGDNEKTTPVETVSLEELIEELIEGGAVAVSLQKTLFDDGNYVKIFGTPECRQVIDDTTLPLRAHMQPVTGHEIAGRYEAVTIDGVTYDFFVEPVQDGPEFFQKVPLYAGENIGGLDAVPVEQGIQNAKNYLTKPGEA